jgi:CopA family copper-resistance protein
MNDSGGISRRDFIKATGKGLFLAGLHFALPLPVWAGSVTSGINNIKSKRNYDLAIGYTPLRIDGRKAVATGINGTVPGPLVRLREGDPVSLKVTNDLHDTEHASIHWHGILVPFPMDGVPGVNFSGIGPGETYQYRYTVKQAGTYWYHSHSRFQEQTGTYGPMIIDPLEGEPFHYDRDHVLVLSDWSFEDPETIFRKINLMGDYYNYQKRTLIGFFNDVSKKGLKPTLADRLAWGKMRMSPVDLADVTGATYTYLMNGNSPAMNWTGLFKPGEIIRLRVINASTMSTFDVRIPGLDMAVVMADGKTVKPIAVHEFRIGTAETYDVLVRPHEDTAFTIFAESMDRSGYARGTLASRPGMEARVPKLRSRPIRTMGDMGMGMMADMGSGNGMKDMDHPTGQMEHTSLEDASMRGSSGPKPLKHVKNNPNVVMMSKNPKNRLAEPGIGLGHNGWKVLTYKDLVSIEPQPYKTEPDREVTIHITANMERYMFSFDGKKFSEHDGPYMFKHNERLRLYLINHTMMEHPIHLHGMWMQLENGAHDLPFKHTVLVKPSEVMSLLITPIEKGDWAFHCHLLYHMEAGMFQVVRVS